AGRARLEPMAIEMDDLVGSIEAEADAGDLVLDEAGPGGTLRAGRAGDTDGQDRGRQRPEQHRAKTYPMRATRAASPRSRTTPGTRPRPAGRRAPPRKAVPSRR